MKRRKEIHYMRRMHKKKDARFEIKKKYKIVRALAKWKFARRPPHLPPVKDVKPPKKEHVEENA